MFYNSAVHGDYFRNMALREKEVPVVRTTTRNTYAVNSYRTAPNTIKTK